MDEDKLIKRKLKALRDGNVKQLAEILRELGDFYFGTEQYQEAIQEYKEQLAACEALSQKLNCAIAHRMIGESYAEMGDYDAALEHQNLYLEGAKETETLLEEQRAYATLGRTYLCLAESILEDCPRKTDALAESKRAFTKSIRLCNKLTDTDVKEKELMTMRARLLLNLGVVLGAQKDAEQGKNYIEMAAEICKKHNLDEELHRVHLALGDFHERDGNAELALQEYETAASINDLAMKANARLAAIKLLFKLGDWKEARKRLIPLYTTKTLPRDTKIEVENFLRIAVTLTTSEEELPSTTELATKLKLYETLGDAAVAVKSFEKAIEYYQKMLSCAKEGVGDQLGAALVSLAKTLQDVGRFAEAVTYGQQELELCKDSREKCRSALFLAELLIKAKSPDTEIIKTYDLAFSSATESDDPKLQVSVLQELLDFYEKTCNSEKVSEIEEKLQNLQEFIPESESEVETEPETPQIGEDICLDDLPELERPARKPREVHKSNVMKRNEKGETPLHVACINNNYDLVEQLLKSGHRVNVRDNCGWTPLHEAANHGHTEIAELLIKSGADVNDPGGPLCEGVTPLHDAASCGHFTMMNLLLQYKANVEAVTKRNETVLDYFEGWRERTQGNLSHSDEAEYKILHQKLLKMMPKRMRKRRSREGNSSERRKNSSFERRKSGEDENEEGEEEKRISAAEVYKNTIDSLKSRGGLLGLPVQQANITPSETAPLLDSEEIVMDDWLEEDMEISPRKKLDSEMNKRKANDSGNKDERIRKRQKIKVNGNNDTGAPEIQKIAIEDILDDESCESVSSESSRSSMNVRKRPKQISLLNAGFTRDSISRTPSPDLLRINSSFPTLSIAVEEFNLTVQLEERKYSMKFKYPEQQKKTVQGIMEDLKKQFESETGCRVQFCLATMNDDLTAPESDIEALRKIGNPLNLKTVATEVEVPPIFERFQTICRSTSIEPQDSTIRCLKACDKTSTFSFKSHIRDEEVPAILQSLEYQKNVQVLNLSGATLFGWEELFSTCLSKLTSLQELYLQGCDINSQFLEKIKHFPPQLRVLDLSYNPLGSECQEKLGNTITSLRYLQTLKLRYCNLSKFYFSIINTSLVNLDISCNPLGGEGVCKFLQRQMLSLNISNTTNQIHSSVISNIMKDFKFSFSLLESLELISCDVNDNDVERILSNSPNISKLNISGNSKVTMKSVVSLLKYMPALSYINVTGCFEIVDVPDSNVYVANPEVCTFVANMKLQVQELWFCLWLGKGTLMKLPHNVVVFKPIM